MVNTRRKRVIIIVSIIVLLMLTLMISYAYFSTELKGTDQIIKVGNLELVLDETGEGISLDNAMSISDSEGIRQEGSTFQLINNGNNPVDYIIYLDDKKIADTDTRIDDKYLKYVLNKNNKNGSAMPLTSIGSNPNRILDSGTIKGKSTNKYKFNLWITDEVDGNYAGHVFSAKLRVEVNQHIKTDTESLIAKANLESLSYDDATDQEKKEMWTFTHDATEQTGILTDYRYIGSDPNNYIIFNDELWRIIGVFDVDSGNEEIEKRLKIIRDESIGTIAFDDESNANNYPTSTLRALLNEGDYYNSTNLYVNSGLNEEAKSMIGNSKWYLGGASDYENADNGLASHFYGYERGLSVYSGRETSWIGKVGLIYPSDYGYATSGGSTTDRNACLNKELHNWNDSAYSDCINNNWLYEPNYYQWTLTPLSTFSRHVLGVDATGFLSVGYTYYTIDVRPVVYLNSNIKIVSGIGSSDDPYRLSN